MSTTPFTPAEVTPGPDGHWIHPDGTPATDREVAAAIWGPPNQVATLTDELTDSNDPRWAYDLTPEQAHRAWPCAATVDGDEACRTRRDEHADQPEQSAFPELDITDHVFIEARDEESA